MDGLIFFFVLIFFILPFWKSISKNAGKSTRGKSANRYQQIAQRLQEEARQRIEQQADHGVTKARKHQQLHRNDSSNVFPEEHQANVRARDQRDRQEYRKMEQTIHGKSNRAMTKVASKGRSDWGVRGDNGMTSSKAIIMIILTLLLAHLVIAAFFPELIPGFLAGGR